MRKAELAVDALEAWDAGQNLDIFCDFLKCQTEKTWEKQIARAEKRGK